MGTSAISRAGPDAAAAFWAGFRERFITERDIEPIAAAGFDHVRLPINARVIQDEAGEPIEAGYAMIDRLIAWCRAQRLWLLLDLHGAPQTPTDRSFNIFFDAGSWHGYSLPVAGDPATGLSGPFVHSLGDGQWAGARFAQLALRDTSSKQSISLNPTDSHAAPGYLVRQFSGPGLTVRQTLFFADSWHALVRIELTATTLQDVDLSVAGRVMPEQQAGLVKDGDTVAHAFAVGDHGQLHALHPITIERSCLVGGHHIGATDHRDVVGDLQALDLALGFRAGRAAEGERALN